MDEHPSTPFSCTPVARPTRGRRVALGIAACLVAQAVAWAQASETRTNALDGGALVRPLRAGDFEPVPGVRELGSRLIVRPVQAVDWRRAGASAREAAGRHAAARRELSRFTLLRHVPQTDDSIVLLQARRSARDVATELLATGLFEYAEPDWLLAPDGQEPVPQGARGPQAALEPFALRCGDDPRFPFQWHHQRERLDSCGAWALHTGLPTVSVGICDTGIRTTHEDLLRHRLEAYNAVDRLWESQGGQIGPVFPHGTRTTGAAAANGNNGAGIVGMGWDLSHRMLRVSNMSNGNAFLSDLQHGARIAVENGDRVANVSYAGVTSASNLPTATYIKSLGGLLVWGAGNSGANLSSPDRDADDLLVVGATDSADALWSSSNYGRFVDLVAPGVAILTSDAASDTAYVTASGTSYAAPMVSGLCALLWSQRPNLSPNDVERLLKLGVDDLGAPGVDDVFGYGRIDLGLALATSGVAPPVAELAAASALGGQSPLTVDFTDLSTGVPSAWSWDFGDGGTSTLPSPSHTYTGSGFFTVSLTVTNALGSDTTTQVGYVTVDFLAPQADFEADPTAGVSPLVVAFQDTSSLGAPTSWSWDFGDGQGSTEQHPVHTYTGAGRYTVSLSAGNAWGSDTLTRVDLVTVDWVPPIAAFGASATSGPSPLVVDFTDQSTGGAPTSWTWSFGDGATSTLQNPTHIYTAEGSYTVALTASNAWGSDQLVQGGYVQVSTGPPIVANFVGTPTSGSAPLQVDFTDLSIGYPVAWEWNFGDDETSNLQNPMHVYAASGEYDVNLTVTTSDGKDDSLELGKYIVVN